MFQFCLKEYLISILSTPYMVYGIPSILKKLFVSFIHDLNGFVVILNMLFLNVTIFWAHNVMLGNYILKLGTFH